GADAVYRRPERRRQPADRAFDPGAVLLQKLGEPEVSLLLFEAQLGIVVDPVGERFQVVRQPIHRARDLALDACDRVFKGCHCWSPGYAGSATEAAGRATISPRPSRKFTQFRKAGPRSLRLERGDRDRAGGFEPDASTGDVPYLSGDGERAELFAQHVDPAGLSELQRGRRGNGDPEPVAADVFGAPHEGLVVDPHPHRPRDGDSWMATALAYRGHRPLPRTSSVPSTKRLPLLQFRSTARSTKADRKVLRRSRGLGRYLVESVIYCLSDQASPDRRRRAPGDRSPEGLLPSVPPRAFVRDRVGEGRRRGADRPAAGQVRSDPAGHAHAAHGGPRAPQAG